MSTLQSSGAKFTSFTLLILVLFATSASSEILDSSGLEQLLTTLRPTECSDYQYNARKMIPRLHRESKFDSIQQIISFVSEKCDPRSFRSYNLLLQISRNEIDSSWCDSAVIDEMLHMQSTHYFYSRHEVWDFLSQGQQEDGFDQFEREFAIEILSKTDSHSIAHALAMHYANRSKQLLGELSINTYAGTCLQRRYDSVVLGLLNERKKFTGNWALMSGLWLPNGTMSDLGVKPELGIQFGLRRNRIGADLTFLFRFLNSPNDFEIVYKDSINVSNHFISIYFGLEPTLIALSSNSFSLELLGGVAYDGIMPLTAKDIDEDAGYYLNSLNLNLGTTIRFFSGKQKNNFIGIQARYHFLDFDREGGSAFSGNAVSIDLLFGGMSHGFSDYQLERLGYFDRKQFLDERK